MSDIKFTASGITGWTRKNKKTIEALYEPTLDNVIELIKLGSASKSDAQAYAYFDERVEEGDNLLDVAADFIIETAPYSSYGVEGVQALVDVIRTAVPDKMVKAYNALKVEDPKKGSEEDEL